MSVTKNDKGAVEQRVHLIKRGGGLIQHNMLKTVLIKHAEKYGLMTEHFVTNHIPAIIQVDRVLITFPPRRDDGEDRDGFQDAEADEKYLKGRSTFTAPGKIYSIARLCELLAQFIRDFNIGLNMQGAEYSPDVFNADPQFVIPQHDIIENHPGDPYDLGNYVAKHDIVDYITLGVESDGRLKLVMTSQFLSNFYLELDPVFAKQIGFPTLIYAHDDQWGVILMSNQKDIPALIDRWDAFDIDPQIHESRTVVSTRSIFTMDERLSIDVEISLPMSHSIDVHDGDESHSFILNRYIITDYIAVECITQQRGGVILTKSIIQDSLATGYTDLVKAQPSVHASQLLNGKIQAFDIRLVLRYKVFRIENKILKHTIARKTIEMDANSSYELLLSFNKRV